MTEIVTIKTKRGEDVRMDSDESLKALAEFFSNMDNEHRFGWTLNEGWYAQELAQLRARCFR